MNRVVALAYLPLALLIALHAGVAQAEPGGRVDCPAAADLEPPQMLGAWRAEVEGQPAASVMFVPNVNNPGSLSGTIDRNGTRSQVAADIDEGEFTMEESSDGVHIAATWLGEVVPDTCGREIRGRWRPEGGTTHAFKLKRAVR